MTFDTSFEPSISSVFGGAPSASPKYPKPSSLLLRSPTRHDGAKIHRLITQCPPLDVNSLYAYLLLSEHFARTSVVAVRNGQLLGYVSGYIPPARPDVLFIWQVAVHPKGRGQGIGSRMLHHILQANRHQGIRYVETTVSPSNRASRQMFSRLAQSLNVSLQESPLFDPDMFQGQSHEEEPLLRLGPID